MSCFYNMNSNTENDDKIILEYHIQQELCTTRLPYRQGRNLTAVKVYSVANESQHLLVFGVPSLNLRTELKVLCAKYGQMKVFGNTSEYPCEQFTESFRVTYERTQSARVAKRFLDMKNFYGGILHVCYAPDFESISETRNKLLLRRRDVLRRLKMNNETIKGIENYTNPYDFAGKTLKEVCKEQYKGHNGREISSIKSNMEECQKMVSEESKAKRIQHDDGNRELKSKRVKMKVLYEKQYEPCFTDSSSAALREEESETAQTNGGYEGDTYKTFGKEDVRIISEKKLNKIVFFVPRK